MSLNVTKRQSPKKIVFLDRDGVINRKADEHCYITKVDDFVFNSGIFDVCHSLKKRGFEFIVITNQRGVSRSIFTEEELSKIHEKMSIGFQEKSIDILDIFYCPHSSDACDCRKPKPGMLKRATERYTIDIGNSILISDSLEDVAMGEEFGLGKSIHVSSDVPEESLQFLQ